MRMYNEELIMKCSSGIEQEIEVMTHAHLVGKLKPWQHSPRSNFAVAESHQVQNSIETNG